MDGGKSCEVRGNKKKSSISRALWLALGMICTVLGAIGIVMPILPTTPFLLAAAACFCKSSPKMYNWLLSNRWFGKYIRNYKEGRGLTVKTKVTALSVLWVTIGISTVFLLSRLLPPLMVLPIQITMVAVALAVSIYLLRLPTFKPEENRALDQSTKEDKQEFHRNQVH